MTTVDPALFSEACIEVLEKPILPANALRPALGSAPAIVLASVGIPVIGLDLESLIPCTPPMLNPSEIIHHFSANRSHAVAFDPGAQGFAVHVSECSGAWRHMLAGRGIGGAAEAMRKSWNAATARVEVRENGVVMAAQLLTGEPTFHELSPLGERGARVQYIADIFIVPHAFVWAVARDLKLREFLLALP